MVAGSRVRSENALNYHLYLKTASAGVDPRFRTKDVIASHNEIAAERGEVFFGKAGRPPGRRVIEVLRSAMKSGQSPKLIVGHWAAGKIHFFSALIRSVHFGHIDPDPKLVPEYYRQMIPFMSFWVRVGQFSKLEVRELRKLVLASSGHLLTDVLAKCSRTTVMLIREKR